MCQPAEKVKKHSDLAPVHGFYFVRHGETAFNRQGRFQGRIDVPLNETGIEQARAAARTLTGHRFSRIVSSPAQRVLQTASFIAEASNVPVHVDDDLMEFYVGSFEGQCIAEIRKAYGLAERDSLLSILPTDADKWQDFAPRVCAAVKRWTDQYIEEPVLIAAHGLVFRALCEALTGKHASSPNAHPCHFKPISNGWDIAKI
jgi:broad specificity phosphatase PhoE